MSSSLFLYNMTRKKILLNSTLLFLFRCLDLISTKFACVDFKNQEQNVMVKVFGLDMFSFFVYEILFAFFLIYIYVISTKKQNVFVIEASTFPKYLKAFFYPKGCITLFDFLFAFSYKNIFYLFGNIIPKLYITTSTILVLNNFWVYLFVKGVQPAIDLYMKFEKMHLIDFIIFDIPALIFVSFMIHRLFSEYKKHRLEPSFSN